VRDGGAQLVVVVPSPATNGGCPPWSLATAASATALTVAPATTTAARTSAAAARYSPSKSSYTLVVVVSLV